MPKKLGIGRRGNIEGLAKHLSKKLGGDPHFFTKCMADEGLQGYSEVQRSGICAKAHKLAIGIWPGEHTEAEKKELVVPDGMSLSQYVNKVDAAWRYERNGNERNYPQSSWVIETYSNYVIACVGHKYYHVGYTIDSNGSIVFEDKSNWTEVEEQRWWTQVVKGLKALEKENRKVFTTFILRVKD